jgi:hypothetical protein
VYAIYCSLPFSPFAFSHQRDDSRELNKHDDSYATYIYKGDEEKKGDSRELKAAAPKKPAAPKKKPAPKKKAAPKKKSVEVREADPWEQTLGVAETAAASDSDNSAATASVGSQWLLMTLPMLYLN